MITNDNTKRAIESLRLSSPSLFHGDLNEYLIEVLEASICNTPSEQDMKLLAKQIKFILANADTAENVRQEIEETVLQWLD